MRWLFLFLMLVPAAALAAPPPHALSLDKLLPQIRHKFPGSLYDVEGPYYTSQGHPRYQLKWMTPNGDILWLVVNGRNGDILHILPGGMHTPYRQPTPERGYRHDGPPPGQGWHEEPRSVPGRGYHEDRYPAPQSRGGHDARSYDRHHSPRRSEERHDENAGTPPGEHRRRR